MNPGLLSYTASYDVASNRCWGLPCLAIAAERGLRRRQPQLPLALVDLVGVGLHRLVELGHLAAGAHTRPLFGSK